MIPTGYYEVTQQQLDQLLSASTGEVIYAVHYGCQDGIKRYYVKTPTEIDNVLATPERTLNQRAYAIVNEHGPGWRNWYYRAYPNSKADALTLQREMAVYCVEKALAEQDAEITRLKDGFADINQSLMNFVEIEKRAFLEGARMAIEKAAQVVEEHSKAPKGITWGKLKTAIRALAVKL